MTQPPNITNQPTGITLPPPPAPPHRRRPLLAAILILFVFIAGTLAGAGLTIAIAVHRLRYAIHHPEEVPARLTSFIDHRLHLTRDQSLQVEHLIAQRQSHLQAIRLQVQPQVQSELDGLHNDIAVLLTPDQQLKWDQLFTDATHNWLPPAPQPPTSQSIQ